MSSMNFPDPNVTPEYKDWVWDGEKWVKDCPASGGGGYDDTQIIADLNQEIADREAGDLALQGQIDALGSGGGGAWEVVDKISAEGVTAFEFELNTDEFRAFRFFVDVGPLYQSDITGCQLYMQLGRNGSYINDEAYNNNAHVLYRGDIDYKSLPKRYFMLCDNVSNTTFKFATHFNVLLSGVRPFDNGSFRLYKPIISYTGASSRDTNNGIHWSGSGTLNHAQGVTDAKIYCISPYTLQGVVTMEGMRD